MVFLQVTKISTLPKESEMDDLEFEIQSAKDDLVRRQAERKLARLTGLQTQGATA
jgi:hypothetical protein